MVKEELTLQGMLVYENKLQNAVTVTTLMSPRDE